MKMVDALIGTWRVVEVADFDKDGKWQYRFGELSCLSWKWRERSSVKITERTYEKRTQALPR